VKLSTINSLVTFAKQVGSVKPELEHLLVTVALPITQNGVSSVPLDHMPLTVNKVCKLKLNVTLAHTEQFASTPIQVMIHQQSLKMPATITL
jgi:hypothetical protein